MELFWIARECFDEIILECLRLSGSACVAQLPLGVPPEKGRQPNASSMFSHMAAMPSMISERLF